MSRFRVRTTGEIIEAERWHFGQVLAHVQADERVLVGGLPLLFFVRTLDGPQRLFDGDYVLLSDGTAARMSPDLFEAMHEPVADSLAA